jgi:hypothetical protein
MITRTSFEKLEARSQDLQEFRSCSMGTGFKPNHQTQSERRPKRDRSIIEVLA